MKDRISTHPGRIKLTPVDGAENQYILEWADEPTQVGTPLSKATFLPDALATRLKLLQEDPTVADALNAMADTMDRACKIAVGEEAPTASTFGDVGDEYIQVKSDTDFVIWKCIKSADGIYEWVSTIKTVKEFHTDIFTTSSEFVAQENIVGNAHIICVGGGGGAYVTSWGGGGGGGGYIRQYTGVIPVGKHTVTIGAGGTNGGSGGTSSFGTLISAPGGGAGSMSRGGNGGSGGGGGEYSAHGGDGEFGGGGGAASYSDSYASSAASSGNRGGNGGTYGGGGGGAKYRWSLSSDYVVEGQPSEGTVFGSGGNSAKYSGAAAVQTDDDNGVTGRSGGGAGYAASATDANGGAGEDTTKLGLDFVGTGLAGTGLADCGGGGGGYGGNGGKASSSGGAGGGGGYGADGGNGYTYGGGGGGWGANGSGSKYSTNGGGGGGGGYGAANYGGGGTATKSSSSVYVGDGNSGVVIVEYWTFAAEVIA